MQSDKTKNKNKATSQAQTRQKNNILSQKKGRKKIKIDNDKRKKQHKIQKLYRGKSFSNETLKSIAFIACFRNRKKIKLKYTYICRYKYIYKYKE